MSIETSEAAILVDGVAMPVRVRRSARARAFRLTIDSARGELRLSLPARANLKKALGWAQDHEGWVRAQMASQPAITRLADGAVFPLEGREVRICWVAGATRTIRLEGDRLLLGGAAESVGARVLRWLVARARAVLETETRELARDHGLIVASVGVGDPRSRWGSCTASGAIRYSWRLILAPPQVRRATVAHELAHLLHMDHSPAFHAAHARIHGADPRPARVWLRTHGAGLHRYRD
ncbi:SprT family zinc-dependent metalloprotease [Sphingobium sp. HBC34]|uniref:SprT family zinc-dependent metalloprotease n=1 Tax=Sphingobium cyanobacteriorum TaxID=3063954 RepID=A0ABT8ZMR2_9SPHN|nr:SprT family zinc-dependent metalloprotease [Sphingobium sp. HBC34]MDO7835813.1 SprT family zinc-dependent metalloprotease [Sphingobium sp. HBC34]